MKQWLVLVLLLKPLWPPAAEPVDPDRWREVTGEEEESELEGELYAPVWPAPVWWF